MKRIVTLILVASTFLFGQSAKVYWVDIHNGNDSNNGLASSSAFKTIQYVFNNASSLLSTNVDTIKVLPSITDSQPNGYYDFGDDGIYLSTSSSNSRNFVMIGIAGADSTIFDAEGKNRHFRFYGSQDSTTIIQGITFKNGYDEYYGGSMFLYQSNISFVSNIFDGNKAGSSGGAIEIGGNASPSFDSCVFKNNFIENNNNSNNGYGGAMKIDGPSSDYTRNNPIKITNTKFLSNYIMSKSNAFGGAIDVSRGINISNSIFIKNHATANTDDTDYDEAVGGAIYANNTWWNNNQSVGMNMYISNSTFDGNYVKVATDDKINVMWGSTISYGRWNSNVSPSAKTFIFNSIIRNTKLYTKSSTYENDDNSNRGDKLGSGNTQGFKLITDYNNIEDSVNESWAGDYTFDIEPGYKDTANGDYSLANASPMIGVGVSNWSDESLSAPTKDIIGITRGSNPDLGAYENSLNISDAPLPVNGLSVSAISSGAKLTWKRNKTSLLNSALASNIQYEIEKDSSGVKTTVTLSDTSYTFNNLKNGKTYSFVVSAKDTQSGKMSIPSKSFTIIPRYLGPKWYVGAGSDGTPKSSQSSDFDWGSKSSPINNLTTALEVYASGDTIIMMKGTHTGSSNRGIIVPNNNKSFVLMGDPEHLASETIIDASNRDRHFYFNGGQDSSWAINHITLYRGKASGNSWEATGGSIRLGSASSPKFKGVIFRENTDETNQSYNGAAIRVTDRSLLLLENCSFINNKVTSTDNQAHGGAINIDANPLGKKHIINGCIFDGNELKATYGARGSAIFSRDAIDITNSVFIRNYVRSVESDPTGTIYYESPKLSTQNNENGTDLYFVNNTIAYNNANGSSNYSPFSGFYYCDYVPGSGQASSILYAFNNIVYGNKSNDEIDDVQVEAHCGGPVIRADYNNIQGLANLANHGGNNAQSGITSFDYSIDVPPAFKDTANGDFSLDNRSLAIGSGTANWSDWGIAAPTKDLLGNSRPNPAGSNPDLGAYENSLAKSPYPSKVAGLVAQGGSQQVTLKWDASSAADSVSYYNIYMSTSSFIHSASTLIDSTTLNTFIKTGLNNALRYYFKITAVNASGLESDPAALNITPTFSGPVWFVSKQGNDANGEGSQGSPFATITHAIKQVNEGDTIIVKSGTYTNEQIVVEGNTPNIVLISESGASNTILDAQNQNDSVILRIYHEDNNDRGDGIDSTFQVIGFTFTRANMSAVQIVNRRKDNNQLFPMRPKFRNCIFTDNRRKQDDGGAVYIEQADPIFENCTFSNNIARKGGAVFIIGGNRLNDTNRAHFRNSTFRLNRSEDENSTDAPQGGAIALVNDKATATITDCIFEENTAISRSEGYRSGGGAIYSNGFGDDASIAKNYLIIDRCVFRANVSRGTSGALGGAIDLMSSARITNSLFDGNKVRIDNEGGYIGGGAIYADAPYTTDGGLGLTFNTEIEIINNTIVNNEATNNNGFVQGAGIFLDQGSEASSYWIFNNIIFYNNSQRTVGSYHDRFKDNFQSIGRYQDFGALINISNNNIGNYKSDQFWDPNVSYDEFPMFKDLANSNFELSDASPMIGSGLSSLTSGSSTKNILSKDILGNLRPNPSGSNPDLGAYENSLSVSPYPNKIKNLSAVPRSKNVLLSWSPDTSSDLKQYNIYQSTNGDFSSFLDTIASTKDTSFIAFNLINGAEYHFWVTAVDTAGFEGPISDRASATPLYNGPNWWIDPTITQSNGEGSFNDPLNTISEAFRRANSGDTLKLKSGLFNENFNDIGNSGTITGTGDQDDYGKLDQITIIGVDGAEQTILSAQGIGRIMNFYNMSKIEIKGLTFKDGLINGQAGGALRFEDIDRVIITDSKFTNNFSDNSGGAININSVAKFELKRVIFFDNTVGSNCNNCNLDGGAISLQNSLRPEIVELIIIDSEFDSNNMSSNGDNVYSQGSVLKVDDRSLVQINNTVFKNNSFNAQGQNSGGGSLINISGPFPQDWNQFPENLIEGNLFQNNTLNIGSGSGGGEALILSINGNMMFRNNIVIDNNAQSSYSLISTIPVEDNNGNGPDVRYHNNTITRNNTGGDIFHAWGFNYGVEFINNIIWQNNTFSWANNNRIAFADQDGISVSVRHNILEKEFIEEGRPSFNYSDNIHTDPLFRNPSENDFRLRGNSPAIDAGTDLSNLVYDYRGYYRTGGIDIGAIESGASKYILAINDSLDANSIITFEDKGQTLTKVDKGQTIQFTITTNDINGNLVSNSNESVNWNVFPSQKYVSFINGDPTTSGGSAKGSFLVTSLTKGEGFRFRIEAEVGDAILRSKPYLIEKLVTGAPPPVNQLTISPNTWTNDPNFKLSWSTPIWSAGRDLLGAIIDIKDVDGINEQNEFVNFPDSGPLTQYSFVVPEPGDYDTKVWLVDELGNEDVDSSRAVKALFDNIPPEKFHTLFPKSYVDQNGQYETSYVPVHPDFEWEDRGDYPSGVEKWHIFIRNNASDNFVHYRTYNTEEVNYNQFGHIQMRDTTLQPLEDGFYEWFVEAQDKANLITFSDTGFFGVDHTPPEIVHNNPLNRIDQGTTSPTISADFFDYASGVMESRLMYRRSGSQSGFISLDLLNQTVNIPGSDIPKQGIEYFIESVDNIGNYGKWPSDYDGRPFHSVQVNGNQTLTLEAEDYGGNEESDYQLFSLPYEIPNALDRILVTMDQAGYPDFNKKYWRLFAYNSGYEEISDRSYYMSMGEAFFFIWNKDKISEPPLFDFGQGHPSTKTDLPFEIYLQPFEWKFFGIPYDFEVPMNQVYTESGEGINELGSVYEWNGSWSPLLDTDNLMPWIGYIVKHPSTDKILIDGRGWDFWMDTDKKPILADLPLQYDEWTIDISATTGSLKDENNTVGVMHIAEDGHDRFDEFEPPMMSGHISLRIDNRDREEAPDLYSVDIRKPTEEGQFWDLQVVAPTNGKRTYVVFDGLGYVPEEYDMFLINKTNRQAISLDIENMYQIANSGSDSDGYIRQDLRLVIGTREFVNENNDGVNLYPDAFILSQNYPNPFNPQTSIRLSLQEDARVDLVVYDLTGKEVTRLVNNKEHAAGYYNFIWNGKNDLGVRVSSGVYLYHAMVRDNNGGVVLNKTRKMILLK